MNISLPDSLKAYVDEQVAGRGFGTSSEYMRDLIRRDQDRRHLRGLLLDGANSEPAGVADAAYFEGLRKRVRKVTPNCQPGGAPTRSRRSQDRVGKACASRPSEP